MQTSTFTISFAVHSAKDREYCLARLTESANSIEAIDDLTYLISCTKPSQLRAVGWALYHTLLAKLCTVVSVSGDAELRAGAYARP